MLRNRRLTRCASELIDPALATVPVGVIAYRNGFRNQPYFTQLFKKWAGQTLGNHGARALD